METAPDVPASSSSWEPDIAIDTTRKLTLSDVSAVIYSRTSADRLLHVYFNARHNQNRKSIMPFSKKTSADDPSGSASSQVSERGKL